MLVKWFKDFKSCCSEQFDLVDHLISFADESTCQGEV